jgi:hypothetical protein
MTNAEIIAGLLGTSEEVVERQLESREPCVEVVDLVELNAALDKAREDEKKVVE